MKFSRVLFLLSLIPSALGARSDDVMPPAEASADDAVPEAIAEEVALEVALKQKEIDFQSML